jgi:hypothetical protein
MPPNGNHINAGEVGTYLFCKRAWAFQRQGAPCAREPERVRGTLYHERHAQRVAAGEQTQRQSSALLIAGVVLIVLASVAMAAAWG